MKIEQQDIPVEDGYVISATRYSPTEGKKDIIVQIHSGTGIPQGLYGKLATFLAENGITALTFDYRGIGKSKPKHLKGFDANMRDWAQKDMTGVFNWVLDKYPSHKKVIVAHSIGGQIIGLMKNNKHIDQIFFIGSSTGYWKDMSSPYKWMLPSLWYFYIPLTTSIYGYANAKKIRQGENLPKGVALEWRNWCTNPNYFASEFDKTLKPLYFENVKAPITSIQITDDPIANDTTVQKLLKFYSNASISVEKISPKAMGVEKIGHFGFFSRKFKETLWNKLIDDIAIQPNRIS